MACHGCGKSTLFIELVRCKRCRKQSGFCGACKSNQPVDDMTCARPSDLIDLNDLVIPTLPSTSFGGFGKSLFLSSASSLERHLEFAGSLLKLLTNVMIKYPDLTGKGQATFCVSVVGKDDEYKSIITYSHEALTHVPNVLKSDSEASEYFIEADPMVYYDKDTQLHFLLDRKPLWKDSKAWKPTSTAGQRAETRGALHDALLLGPYKPYPSYTGTGAQNAHHAEMRAVTYAAKRGLDLHLIHPTRDCCPKCHDSLSSMKLLGLVPSKLRGVGEGMDLEETML